jgi:hypothetical protein
MPPDEATGAWMDRYIEYMTTKRGMADALRAVIASGGTPYAQNRDRLITAVTSLLQAGPVPPGSILLAVRSGRSAGCPRLSPAAGPWERLGAGTAR